MRSNNKNNRRSFLRTAGAALVAASVPTILVAQKEDARPPTSGNNMKQMIIFGGVAEPNPGLPGVLGQSCFQFQMCADIGETGGFGTLSDPMFSDVNSHIQFDSGRVDINDYYVFRGTCSRSQNPDFVGKAVTVKVKVLADDNCDLSLTIENTPVAGLLLPAIQKVRDKSNR